MAEERFAAQRSAARPLPVAGVQPTTGHRAKRWPWAVAAGAVLLILLLYSLGSPSSPPVGQGQRPITGGQASGLGNSAGQPRGPRIASAGQFEPAGNPTVYITRTGNHYHRAGCRYLAKSCIPVPLKEAFERGELPCSRCRPPTLADPDWIRPRSSRPER